MRCVVFELAGGGHICAPPGRAKVAQTPGRARVNILSARGLLKNNQLILQVNTPEDVTAGPASAKFQLTADDAGLCR